MENNPETKGQSNNITNNKTSINQGGGFGNGQLVNVQILPPRKKRKHFWLVLLVVAIVLAAASGWAVNKYIRKGNSGVGAKKNITPYVIPVGLLQNFYIEPGSRQLKATSTKDSNVLQMVWVTVSTKSVLDTLADYQNFCQAGKLDCALGTKNRDTSAFMHISFNDIYRRYAAVQIIKQANGSGSLVTTTYFLPLKTQ